MREFYIKEFLKLNETVDLRYLNKYLDVCLGTYDKDVKCEYHHVLPRSIFVEHKENPKFVVRISLKAHYLAHRILTKAIPNNVQMKHAHYFMSHTERYKGFVTSRVYEVLREFHYQKNLGNKYNLGKKNSDETKRKRTVSWKKSVEANPEGMNKFLERNFGNKHAQGCKWMHNPTTDETSLIPSDKIQSRLSEGWIYGRKSIVGRRWKMSDQGRRNVSESKKGSTQSDSTRQKRSEALKGNKNSLGYKHSSETSRKLSDKLKGNSRTKGYRWMSCNNVNKLVAPDEFNQLSLSGWKFGKSKVS
ncbi:homing endonuclease protein [Rhizobium phage RHph_TM40]|uniref:Homing endonuclease protein n=1 Tax=Rhizobium phage RHph_TM30 TaxID=2509764 RepID=A0A7S5R5C5_9CAUD|nr:homing endonuclease [Rhizobium phage RHph_TM30]QIG71375.1 homing endonuclease protein [Rhizobium phage RHph_TM30]QIG71739.1 homing endonuclease protein [Rhizobium phage RHph_TM40]